MLVGSAHCSTIRSTSSSVCARSVTAPSVSVGTCTRRRYRPLRGSLRSHLRDPASGEGTGPFEARCARTSGTRRPVGRYRPLRGSLRSHLRDPASGGGYRPLRGSLRSHLRDPASGGGNAAPSRLAALAPQGPGVRWRYRPLRAGSLRSHLRDPAPGGGTSFPRLAASAPQGPGAGGGPAPSEARCARTSGTRRRWRYRPLRGSLRSHLRDPASGGGTGPFEARCARTSGTRKGRYTGDWKNACHVRPASGPEKSQSRAILSGHPGPGDSFHFGNYLGALRQWVDLQEGPRPVLLHRRPARPHRAAGTRRCCASASPLRPLS